MKVTFWGVRGSVPTPGPHTVKYGGNTTCIGVELSNGQHFVIDAGTGVRELGLDLINKGPVELSLLITHSHLDHIIGFPFFAALYNPANKVNVYGKVHYEKGIREVLGAQMEYSYFPLSQAELPAQMTFNDITEGSFDVGEATVRCRLLNHPVLNMGYRIEHDGKSMIFTGDTEKYYDLFDASHESAFDETHVTSMVEQQNRQVEDFCRDVDVLVCDAAYTPEEYETHRGWGHMSWEHAVDLAGKSNAKTLVLSHHEPTRSDEAVEAIVEEAKAFAKAQGYSSLNIQAAREKESISW